MNSLLGKAGSCGKNNSSNVLQKQNTLKTSAGVFSPFRSLMFHASLTAFKCICETAVLLGNSSSSIDSMLFRSS